MGILSAFNNIAGAGGGSGAPVGNAPPAMAMQQQPSQNWMQNFNPGHYGAIDQPGYNENQQYAAGLIGNVAKTAAGGNQSFDPFYAMMNASIENQRAGLNQDYGFDLAYLGLSQSALGANKDLDLAGVGLDRERLGLNRERLGITRQGTNVDEGEVRRGADAKIRGINQDFTARGSWFAPEKGGQVGDTYAQRDADLERINLRRQGLDVDEKGIGIDERGIGLREQGILNNFNQNMAKYGLDKQQLNAHLKQKLEQIGIGNMDLPLDQMLKGIEQGGQGGAMYEWLLKNLLPMMF